MRYVFPIRRTKAVQVGPWRSHFTECRQYHYGASTEMTCSLTSACFRRIKEDLDQEAIGSKAYAFKDILGK